MKPFAPLVALLAAITPAMPVVAQVGLSIQIGQPNVYGGPFSPASTAATNLSLRHRSFTTQGSGVMPLTDAAGQFILFAISGIERITFPASGRRGAGNRTTTIARDDSNSATETTKGAGIRPLEHSWLFIHN